MNIPSSPLKENLISFFYECESLLTQYKLQDFQKYNIEYRFIRKTDRNGIFSQNVNRKTSWHFVRLSSQEKMKNIESINFCVESFIKYFGLPCANKKLYQSDNVVENSQDEYKQQLVFLFFKYKELQEEINISIPEYVTLLIKGVWSKSIYFKTTAQLIGFKTNLEKIKIHNFTIRLPTNEELNRIMNDHEWSFLNISYPSDIASHGINIIQDTHFWAFMETQQNRLENLDALYTVRSLYTHRELLYDEDNIKIIPEYKRLILALRLYNGNYTGIRSLFIKKLFIYEGDLFEPWREYPFLDAKFNDFRKNRFSLDLKRKEITSEDVTKINTVFSKLMLYEQNPLKQINKALDHFFQAFEQTYPVYIFTELIMTFETLFNENIKSTSKEEVNLIKEIRNANTEKKGLKILKKYIHRNSIQKSIDMLNQLLYPGEYNEDLNTFFSPSYNNSCYRIRNNLLHGNLSLDSAEIRKKIPDLEEYVRLALLKIIELRINDKLDCNEENYFEKLKEVSKVNVRG